jgi:hypothetical protein
MQKIIDTFEIPVELAKELSEIMAKHGIRMNLLMNLVNDPEKYDEAERLLIPIAQKFDALKLKVTREYVPAKYKTSDRYIWNYNGWEMAENRVEIIDSRA